MRGLSRASAIGATYPNSSNTGATITPPTTSVNVPSGATSGTGWTWNSGTSTVTVTGTVSGLNITGAATISSASASLSNSIVSGIVILSGAGSSLSGSTVTGELQVSASNVTLTGCGLVRVVVAYAGAVSNTLIDNCTIIRAPTGDGEGIKLGNGTTAIPTDTTIRNCTIAGLDNAANRLGYGVDDNFANLGGVNIPGGILVLGCNIYNCRTSLQLASGIVQGNYIHDPGITGADHVDCFLTQGGADLAGPLVIRGNTMLDNLTQTSAILLGSSVKPAAYMTVDSNLLAGGSYPIYGGNTSDANIRTDTAAGNTGGTASVTDTAAVAGDLGATLTCTTGGVIPANTTIVNVSGTTYTLSQSAVGTHSGVTFQVQHPYGTRTDPLCTISGGTTLTDPSLVPADAGAAVTGTGIPAGTTIGTPSGTTATLSQACTNESLTVTMHYTNNIVVTNNRVSTIYFPNGGTAGLATDFDQFGAGNVWTNNVVHETGVQIPA